MVFVIWFTLRGPIRSDGLEKGVDGALPGRQAAHVILAIFVFWFTLRGRFAPMVWKECRSSFTGAASRPGWSGDIRYLVHPPGADSFRSCGKNRKKGTSKERAFHKAALPFEIPSSETWKAALVLRLPCASPASGRAAQGSGFEISLSSCAVRIFREDRWVLR